MEDGSGGYESEQERLDRLYGERRNAENAGHLRNFSNNSGISLYGSQAEQEGEVAARQNASIYYGNSQDIGKDAADYRSRVKGNLDKSSGLANRYIQSANADIARGNNKSGLNGVNTTAATIAARRGATAKADEMQQQFGQQNLSTYGKSIGAGISGTESLAAAGSGKALAAKPGQTPDYDSGLFGSIICTETYRQKRINIHQLKCAKEFAQKEIDDETFYGYLVLARPVVWLMRRSALFSDLWFPWVMSISNNEKNSFTRFMIPLCRIIGKIKLLGVRYAR